MKFLVLILLFFGGLSAKDKDEYRLKIYEDFYLLGTKTFKGVDYEITSDSVYLYKNDTVYLPFVKSNIESLEYKKGNYAFLGFVVGAGVGIYLFRDDYSPNSNIDETLAANALIGGLGALLGYGIKKYKPIPLSSDADGKHIGYSFYPRYNMLYKNYEIGLQIRF